MSENSADDVLKIIDPQLVAAVEQCNGAGLDLKLDVEQISGAAPKTDMCDILREAWEDQLESERYSKFDGPRDYVYASGFRECGRAMALDLLHPNTAGETFTPDTLERFKKGNEREDAIAARLLKIKARASEEFDFIEQQQRFTVWEYKDGKQLRPLIVGKRDGRIKFKETNRTPIIEVKSGESVKQVRTMADMEAGKWTSKYIRQLMICMYAEEEPSGIFILDRPGIPTFIELDLETHFDVADEFVVKAQAAVSARFGEEPLPDFCGDIAECQNCPHYQVNCEPPEWNMGEGVEFVIDDDMLELMEQREENEDAAKLFKTADKILKEKFRGMTDGILGPFKITGKWGSLSKFPDSFKPLMKLLNGFKAKDPQGSFRLTFTRILDKVKGEKPE